jgi:hypothetical protein
MTAPSGGTGAWGNCAIVVVTEYTTFSRENQRKRLKNSFFEAEIMFSKREIRTLF